MREFSLPRFALAFDERSPKAISVALGMVFALRKRQLATRVVLLGSHFNLATVFKHISGRSVLCLDYRQLNQDQILKELVRVGVSSDLLFMISDRGFFDGQIVGSSSGSLADLAKLTATPVISFYETDALSLHSAAISFQALAESRKDYDFAGLILGLSGGLGVMAGDQSSIVRKLLPKNLLACVDLDLLDALKTNWDASQQVNDTLVEHSFLNKLSAGLSSSLDIQAVIDIARAAPPATPDFQVVAASKRTRIAVADDSCFALSYQSNVDLLRFYGAEIIPFSPISDRSLPSNIGGLYLPGAFMNDYAADLFGNRDMIESVWRFCNSGGVVYSEGYGSAYLFSKIKLQSGKIFDGVGLYPGEIRLKNEAAIPQICGMEMLDDSIIGAAGARLSVLWPDDAKLDESEPIIKIAKVQTKKNEIYEGYSASAQAFSTFGFICMASHQNSAKGFVDAATVKCPITKS